MKGLSTFAFAVGLLSGTGAIHLQERSDVTPRVVAFPLERRRVSNPVLRDRLRRRGTVASNLDNLETLYFVNATLGTPPQTVRLHLDTGSSDLWVNTPKSKLCQRPNNPCRLAGAFAANSSSTYNYVASDFNISYVDGSGASGDYVTDTVTIGGVTLKNLQFGVGYNSSSAQGILGIGYEVNEVQVGRAGKKPYPNLPAQMVNDGLIASKTFSLWLNDLDASTGSIIFGGVDTAQYQGTLQRLPVQATNFGSDTKSFSEFLITLTGVTLGKTVIARNQAQAVLLDSGSSLSYLPDEMTEAIYVQIGAQYDSSQGAAYVPCALGSTSQTLSFSFSGPSITVGMDELVIPVSGTNGRSVTFSDGTPACLFGIAPAGRSTSVLGDTFMRSAYLVYDLANNEISIAQTNFNATSSNIVEITSGPEAVPNSVPVMNPVAAIAGVTGSRVPGSGGSGTGGRPSRAAATSVTLPPQMLIMTAIGMWMMHMAM